MNGKEPNKNQINSAHRLCSRLLFESGDIPNINGWEDIYGHKELGGKTACPGDSWPIWKPKLIAGIPDQIQDGAYQQRLFEVTKLYQIILGRDPDQDGLTGYAKSQYSIDQIRKIITESIEHKQILERASRYKALHSLIKQANEQLLISVKMNEEILKKLEE
jgi:hypothetical protein